MIPYIRLFVQVSHRPHPLLKAEAELRTPLGVLSSASASRGDVSPPEAELRLSSDRSGRDVYSPEIELRLKSGERKGSLYRGHFF